MTANNPSTEVSSKGSESNTRSTTSIHLLARYRPALQELALVICRSAFFPLIIGMAAWELRDGYDTSSLSGAICRSAFLLLPAIFMARILARSLRPAGLVKLFFGWSDELVLGLRKCISRIQWIVLPCQFVFLSMQTFELGKWNDSLGRIFFMGSMVALGLGLWRASIELKHWSKTQFDSTYHLASRFFCWGALAAAVSPVAICGMSAFGFQFGAEQMGIRLIASVLLTVFTAVMTGFASHMLLVTQFKIKLRRLTAGRDAKEKRIDVGSIDIQDISAQVNRLLSVIAIVALFIAAWNIWGSVFPANSYLDSIQLWKGPLDDAGQESWITLRDLLSGFVVAVVTMVLSRNLPGLLEITILDRLPLDRGGRYAISFVCRYVVGIAGILLTCQMLGFSWDGLKWLAAGLTVGLGFGLQEIFANLVSGIIILIERPVRVGDFITVNGTSGTVIRIQLRATTIQDTDHRELIVPNKKFITEDVMNWTLTDMASRAIFQVGVAYGSDTDLVEEKLLEVAHQHPMVLRDPAPTVVFSAFGDSTLNFELRLHVPNREVFPKIQHEINMQIDRAFRSAEIEIAFPQRELHIRPSTMAVVQQALSGSPAPGSIQPQKQNGDQLPKAA